MKHLKKFNEKISSDIEENFKNEHGELFSLKIEYGSIYIKGEDINVEYKKLEDVLISTIFDEFELDIIEKFIKKYKNKIPTNKYKIYQEAFTKTYKPKYINSENEKEIEDNIDGYDKDLTEKFKFLIGKKMVAKNSDLYHESPIKITTSNLTFTPSDVKVIRHNDDLLLFIYIQRENRQGDVEAIGKYKNKFTKSKEYGIAITSYIYWNIIEKMNLKEHFDVLVYDIPINNAVDEFFS